MCNVASESDQITFSDPDPLSFTAPLIKKTRLQSVESTLWGKVQGVCTAATRASDRDQFLHFVRPRAQCVALLRSSFVDISALHQHWYICTSTVALFGTLSPSVCTSIVGQMADRVSDPSLPWSTQVHPGYQIPPRSTLIQPGLPRSSKVYHGPTQTRSASCRLGQE